MSVEPTFEFPGPILKREAIMSYHYLPVPTDVAEALIKSGTKRVIATINGVDENRAIQVTANGKYYLIFGLQVLKRLGARPEDVVIISLKSDPHPNVIEIPEELKEVLNQDHEAGERFYGMTPGKQRSICMFVSEAKRAETRIKRALEMAYKLRTYSLHGDNPNA